MNRPLVLLLLLMLAWTIGSSQKTLFLSSTTMSWNSGRTYCATHGGRLATVKSRDIQSQMDGIIASTWSTLYEFWFGLRYGSDNKWYWSDGTKAHLTMWANWAWGEPDNLFTDKCVRGRSVSGTYRWKTRQCSVSYLVLCEKDTEQSTSTTTQSTTVKEIEPSTTVAENEPSTTVTENEPSTTVTENEHSTTVTESEPSTTVTESEPSTTVTESEPSTTVTESEPSTTVTESVPSTTVTTDEPLTFTVSKTTTRLMLRTSGGREPTPIQDDLSFPETVSEPSIEQDYKESDHRPSAIAIGLTGSIIVAIFLCLMGAADVRKVSKDIRQMCRDVRSRFCY